MAWTYDPAHLEVPLNAVRLLIGDTNAADPQLQNEEIQAFIDVTDSNAGAGSFAARALQAKYARSVDKWVGDLKILASQRARAYEELNKVLAQQARGRGVPTAGGVYVAEKEAMEQNDALVKPSFRIGMHDNPPGTVRTKRDGN